MASTPRTNTSETEVQSILGSTDTPDMTTQLATARELVDSVLVGKGLSDNLLRLIEANLTAHYIAITDQKFNVKSEKVGDNQTGFSGGGGVLEDGLRQTRFGKQAISLDYTNTLARLGNQNPFVFKSISRKKRNYSVRY